MSDTPLMAHITSPGIFIYIRAVYQHILGFLHMTFDSSQIFVLKSPFHKEGYFNFWPLAKTKGTLNLWLAFTLRLRVFVEWRTSVQGLRLMGRMFRFHVSMFAAVWGNSRRVNRIPETHGNCINWEVNEWKQQTLMKGETGEVVGI